jgi:hypothetical protein
MAARSESLGAPIALEPVRELLTALVARGRDASLEAVQAFRALGPAATKPLVRIAIGDFEVRPGVDRWRLT